MMALLLGDWNTPNPRPITKPMGTKAQNVVSTSSTTKAAPNASTSITRPPMATLRNPLRSDQAPAIGAMIPIASGSAVMANPTPRGASPTTSVR